MQQFETRIRRVKKQKYLPLCFVSYFKLENITMFWKLSTDILDERLHYDQAQHNNMLRPRMRADVNWEDSFY